MASSIRRLELARIMFKRAIKINPRHTTSICHLAMLCESMMFYHEMACKDSYIMACKDS
jgi:hypothetical protein